MLVIKYNEAYLDDIINSLVELKEEDKGRDWFKGRWLNEEYYRHHYLNPESKYDVFIALKGLELAGFIIGEPLDKDIYSIEMHYVPINFRRNGVARGLKRHLTTHAEKKRFKEIWSYVGFYNPPSISLNKKLGWELERMDDCYKFVKKLSNNNAIIRAE